MLIDLRTAHSEQSIKIRFNFKPAARPAACKSLCNGTLLFSSAAYVVSFHLKDSLGPVVAYRIFFLSSEASCRTCSSVHISIMLMSGLGLEDVRIPQGPRCFQPKGLSCSSYQERQPFFLASFPSQCTYLLQTHCGAKSQIMQGCLLCAFKKHGTENTGQHLSRSRLTRLVELNFDACKVCFLDGIFEFFQPCARFVQRFLGRR